MWESERVRGGVFEIDYERGREYVRKRRRVSERDEQRERKRDILIKYKAQMKERTFANDSIFKESYNYNYNREYELFDKYLFKFLIKNEKTKIFISCQDMCFVKV